ncbi:MAG: hypothetical protein PHN18_04580 [Sulfurospirillaceae bacterium]|nr:hypothetical protein [Sulfurospirillaceae bacterium]MDD2825317.1 hypothetical protein [Sulfurospirillaceae bacterium]
MKIKESLLWLWREIKPLSYKSLESFFISLGVFIPILIIFYMISYMPLTSLSRPLIKIFAKQVGTSDPYVIEMINNGIKTYAKQYEEQIIKETIEKKTSSFPTEDEFSRLLYQLEYDSYPTLLLHNLEDLKQKISPAQYSNMKSLYSELILFWAKLYNGVYGTDTSKAFNDYYDVIAKYRCQRVSLRKEISDLAQNKFHQEDIKAQIYFSQLYRWPIDALIFEINLRTLAMTPKEAADKITSQGKYIFNITRKNSGISAELLGSQNLCN